MPATRDNCGIIGGAVTATLELPTHVPDGRSYHDWDWDFDDWVWRTDWGVPAGWFGHVSRPRDLAQRYEILKPGDIVAMLGVTVVGDERLAGVVLDAPVALAPFLPAESDDGRWVALAFFPHDRVVCAGFLVPLYWPVGRA